MDGINTAINMKAIVAAVRSVIGPGTVGLHTPDITIDDIANVAHCAANEPVGYGYINKLEGELPATCWRDYAIAVSSGTAALHLALLAVGVKPGDEVIIPDMTFIAAANAVTYCGAHPLLLDVNHDGLSGMYAGEPLAGYLPLCYRQGDGLYSPMTDRRIAAIVVVDLLGVPCDLAAISALAKGYGIPLIEDAAEALGSTLNGQPCGSFGDVSIISFNNNKIVTSGGGGAVLTDNGEIAERVRHLSVTAKTPSRFFYEHDAVGFNYRMSNLGAALALGQLRRLSEIVKRKRRIIGSRYQLIWHAFDDSNLILDRAEQGFLWNAWLAAISVLPHERDTIMRALHDDGIPCRALFTPIHMQAPYRTAPRIAGTRATAKFLFDRVICLPSGPNL